MPRTSNPKPVLRWWPRQPIQVPRAVEWVDRILDPKWDTSAMAKGKNQHFVPQFYFRLFTGGENRIHLLNKKDSRIIRNASIKGQCAKHRFYGSDEIERWLCLLEGQQSVALREIRDLAWSHISMK